MINKSRRNHDREYLALVLALSRSYQQFLRSMIPVFRQAGLTPSQWDILETLSSKGPLSVNELIDSALSSSGNLDVVIKNLMRSGLVIKTIAQSDRRGRIVSLTIKGKTKVKQFYPVHNVALENLFGGLSSIERRQYIKELNQLRKKMAIAEITQEKIAC